MRRGRADEEPRLSRFVANFDAVNRAFDEAMVEAMNVMALTSSRLVRNTLSQRGTGRIYAISTGTRKTKRQRKARNPRSAGYHQASAPGQPPAVDTNRLRQSWTVTPLKGTGASSNFAGNHQSIESRGGRVVLTYGSNLFYAPFLEYGTSRMKPRPYLRPTMPLIAKAVEPVFATALARKFGRRTR